jgi:ABC-type antimicrobial peptide transport system permease subunit
MFRDSTSFHYANMKTAFHLGRGKEGGAEREPTFLEKLDNHPLTWWVGSILGVIIIIVGGYYAAYRHNYDWGQSCDP